MYSSEMLSSSLLRELNVKRFNTSAMYTNIYWSAN